MKSSIVPSTAAVVESFCVAPATQSDPRQSFNSTTAKEIG